jgi:AraC-like DNA-binding protein
MIYIISATVLLILSLVVSFKTENTNPYARFFLAGYFWSFFLAVTIAYLVLSPFIEIVPHLFRTGNIFLLLIMPFSWFYFRCILGSKKFSFTDLFHLIPVLLYVVDYFPFFSLPASEKMKILHSLSDYGIKAKYGEGWFMPPGSHNLIRYLVMLGYWFSQGYYLLKAVRISSLQTGTDFTLHRKWLIWLHFSQPLIFVPALVAIIVGRIDIMVLLANIFGLVSALIQGYFLLTNPRVLYGIPTDLQALDEKENDLFESVANPKNDKDIHHKSITVPEYIMKLDDSTLDNIGTAIDKVMREKKLYLDSDLKISDLAMATGFVSYKLSGYFNKRCNQTFNDYINMIRVEHCAQKMDSGESQSKTLEALSKESGFHSRSTFTRAFKKLKGMTPSEYIERSH